MKKIGILLISMLCGYVTYAQNYNEYIETAQKHLQQGNYEKAQASYKVYVNMTGQTSDDFEKLLRNHKQNVAKQEGFIDLGLPSGTCWAQPSTSLYSYEDAKSLINNTGVTLPTTAQYRELIDNSKWRWTGTGFKVTGLMETRYSLLRMGPNLVMEVRQRKVREAIIGLLMLTLYLGYMIVERFNCKSMLILLQKSVLRNFRIVYVKSLSNYK